MLQSQDIAWDTASMGQKAKIQDCFGMFGGIDMYMKTPHYFRDWRQWLPG